MAVQKIIPQQIDATGTSNTQVLTSNGTSTYWGTGVSGYTGSLGGTGYAGSIGIGYAGSAGTNGYAGSNGSNGYAGSNGTNGYTGSIGIGYAGSIGIGYTGSASAGYTGSFGLGYAGSAGTPGTAATAVRQSYTADGATSVFTVSGGYSPNQISVFLNGVMLRNGSEVTVTNGSTFTIAFTPPNGTLIDVIGSLTVVPSGISAGKAITLALIFGG